MFIKDGKITRTAIILTCLLLFFVFVITIIALGTKDIPKNQGNREEKILPAELKYGAMTHGIITDLSEMHANQGNGDYFHIYVKSDDPTIRNRFEYGRLPVIVPRALIWNGSKPTHAKETGNGRKIIFYSSSRNLSNPFTRMLEVGDQITFYILDLTGVPIFLMGTWKD